jgi:hypothetical protein
MHIVESYNLCLSQDVIRVIKPEDEMDTQQIWDRWQTHTDI